MGSDDIFKSTRKEYKEGELHETGVERDPLAQFSRWFKAAGESQPVEPNACALATCGSDHQPTVRMVLLKSYDQRGFVFYTNYESRKGEALKANPLASLLFYWPSLERQVRVEGRSEKVASGEADEYFSSRPQGAQIGAAISKQSRVAETRATIEDAFKRFESQLEGNALKRPDHWGGYRIVPNRIEFWQGRENRLHDRLCYELKGNIWQVVRLWP